MRSDIITIDNSGNGFDKAIEQTKKVAAYKEIDDMAALHLQMLTEEILSLARSVTGEMNANFWIEFEGGQADLHMTTQTVLNAAKRSELLSAATSRKNEAAKTLLGRLRDLFDEARASQPEQAGLTQDVLKDLPHGIYGEPEWDGYERSILRSMADDVKIGIRGDCVEITVTKRF